MTEADDAEIRCDRDIVEWLQWMTGAACSDRFEEAKDEIERLRELLGELANLGVPQNGRGCLYCGTMTSEHKPVCEVPYIHEALNRK